MTFVKKHHWKQSKTEFQIARNARTAKSSEFEIKSRIDNCSKSTTFQEFHHHIWDLFKKNMIQNLVDLEPQTEIAFKMCNLTNNLSSALITAVDC